MSWLRACFIDRDPRTETEAMKRQSSNQEHEVIELQEVNGEESEVDHKKPLNSSAAAMSKVGISVAHLMPVELLGKYHTVREVTLCRNIL